MPNAQVLELKQAAEMSFAEFAQLMQPSGAVNRFPAIGAGLDMYSYSVYMNGPLTKALPEYAREHTFKDVMVTALTEKLGLNSAMARDNLKVAELVALRSTWMSAVLEASTDIVHSAQVLSDYEKLTDGLSHPWIAAELEKQRLLSWNLVPSMAKAGVLKDVIPKETSVGQVIGQDGDFTFQQTSEGEIVTHENRRLAQVPTVGSEITVSYYRGTGQVVNSLDRLKVSLPFIDLASDDLAIMVMDGSGSEQLILFNSMVSFNKFVRAHQMDNDLVRVAVEVRDASPKAALVPPKRELVSPPYIDKKSTCLALDYKEKGVIFTALFYSATAMASLAAEFDLGSKALDTAFSIAGELSTVRSFREHEQKSFAEIVSRLQALGHKDIQTAVSGASYVGKVIEGSDLHVAQSIGRGGVVVHSLHSLDKVVRKGDAMTVKIDNGRGRVSNVEQGANAIGR